MLINRPTVIGGGSWGTALAHLLAHAGKNVHLLSRNADIAAAVNEKQENFRYLPNLKVHEGVRATLNPEILLQSDAIILAVPCQNLSLALSNYEKYFPGEVIIINAAKGMETGSLRLPKDIVAQHIPHLKGNYATLSGPSFARELMQQKPTAVVLGAACEKLGESLREAFSTPWFRAYSSTDVLGVELGGAVKNVMAIAAGMSDGLGYGHNARAALISRGIVEMSRLGVALGARAETLFGLSGLGDMVLTCTGDLSRNRSVGLLLGAGRSLDAAITSLGQAVEGVKTAASLHDLAIRLTVDMPIASAVYAVLYEGQKPQDAVQGLLERSLKKE